MLKDVRYLELILYKTYAELRAEAARTYVSFLWWVAEPLLHMLIFYVVFSVLLGQGTKDFVPFLLIGLSVWKWFDSTVHHAAGAIIDNAALMHQIYLPKVIFPMVTVLIDSVKFIIVLVVLLVFLLLYGVRPAPSWLALPAVLGVEFLLILGMAFLVAAVIPFLPDLRILVESTLMLLMFVSGVFYDPNTIPEHYRGWFYMNPFAVILQDSRDCLLYGRWPRLGVLATMGFAGLGIVMLGYGLLRRLDRVYPRVL